MFPGYEYLQTIAGFFRPANDSTGRFAQVPEDDENDIVPVREVVIS
jgi:hypothetical protein